VQGLTAFLTELLPWSEPTTGPVAKMWWRRCGLDEWAYQPIGRWLLTCFLPVRDLNPIGVPALPHLESDL
jgi:hypothetical protein